ncbi:MAG: hypothetical protein FH748_10110 [Balneolaceae bacterium]|nr:hypothetical protein [Balneolaceae bacterium]
MISKISLNKVASYKKLSVLETDKKVNLIYGLNGTGKSILSNFLYLPTHPDYKHSSVDGLDESHDILVYNETFIQDIFYESESLPGIFTLSKENKEAEQRIANAEKEINRIEKEKEVKEKELANEESHLTEIRKTAKNKIWEIKKDYTGGDRVLEFSLEGYKGDSNKLLTFIESIEKPESKPQKSIDQLKQEVQSLSGGNAQKYNLLPQISFTVHDIEQNDLFEKQIIGNENSSVAGLINKLGNSDWVKDGIKYLPKELNQEKEACPFASKKLSQKN